MLNFTNEPMVKASNQVHTTTDYFLFKPIDGNRNKNFLHLSRLKKSIAENYLFTVIIVNENYEIIDGQHRFECIRELNLPLNYIVCSGYGLNEVHVLNQNSKTWNADDYLTGYCNLGYEDYLKYKRFKDKYQFGHNECMGMLSNQLAGNGALFLKFKDGNFKVTHLKQAEHKAEKIWMLKNLYEGFKRRSFVYALIYLFDKPQFEFTEFLQKIKNQPTSLINCNDTKQYVSLIEEIYNYRRKDKVNLRY
jgi:hypothetical protein